MLIVQRIPANRKPVDYTPDILGINELQRAHTVAEFELQRALLEGAPVDEIREKSKLVTDLAIAIHKRTYPIGNQDPSQTPFRTS
jgi:hypothetical protein